MITASAHEAVKTIAITAKKEVQQRRYTRSRPVENRRTAIIGLPRRRHRHTRAWQLKKLTRKKKAGAASRFVQRFTVLTFVGEKNTAARCACRDSRYHLVLAAPQVRSIERACRPAEYADSSQESTFARVIRPDQHGERAQWNFQFSKTPKVLDPDAFNHVSIVARGLLASQNGMACPGGASTTGSQPGEQNFGSAKTAACGHARPLSEAGTRHQDRRVFAQRLRG